MAKQTRVPFGVAAVELGITDLEMVRLVRDFGVEVEGGAISAEDQSFLLAFRPSEFCTRQEAAQILGVDEDTVQSLANHESLPHSFCRNRLKFPREAIRALAADDHERQRRMINAPRRVPVTVPKLAAVAENATVAVVMQIEETPRKTTEWYVLWMMVASLAIVVGAIIFQVIWGPPPPGG